ncbi:hypothetical protein ACFQY9_12335 [Microvirga aerilata]|uniref:hypothetical protein n=1 Tax=Microvirga aerilata TaxID=670292 RepID=UPI00192304DF
MLDLLGLFLQDLQALLNRLKKAFHLRARLALSDNPKKGLLKLLASSLCLLDGHEQVLRGALFIRSHGVFS